jgi:hypothetical protein
MEDKDKKNFLKILKKRKNGLSFDPGDKNSINTRIFHHYSPKNLPNPSKLSNKAIMSQFDTSIARMKSSFDAIAAAKTHAVVLDFVPNRKTTGRAGATVKTTTKVVKPAEAEKPVEIEKPVEKYVEYTKQPEGIQGIIPEEVISKTSKKAAPKKSSKLKKLLRGKVVDCSA